MVGLAWKKKSREKKRSARIRFRKQGQGQKKKKQGRSSPSRFACLSYCLNPRQNICDTYALYALTDGLAGVHKHLCNCNDDKRTIPSHPGNHLQYYAAAHKRRRGRETTPGREHACVSSSKSERASERASELVHLTCMLTSDGACTPQMVQRNREWPAAPPFLSARPACPPPLFCCRIIVTRGVENGRFHRFVMCVRRVGERERGRCQSRVPTFDACFLVYKC